MLGIPNPQEFEEMVTRMEVVADKMLEAARIAEQASDKMMLMAEIWLREESKEVK